MDRAFSLSGVESKEAETGNGASPLDDLLEGYNRLRNHYKKLAEISEQVSHTLREEASANRLTIILKQKMTEVGSVQELSKHLVHLQKEIEKHRTLTSSERECVLNAREELRKTMDYALKMDEDNQNIISRKGVKINRLFR